MPHRTRLLWLMLGCVKSWLCRTVSELLAGLNRNNSNMPGNLNNSVAAYVHYFIEWPFLSEAYDHLVSALLNKTYQ